MLEKENNRLKENEIENERGRSMVEMLGVLAIMGVLAIGGIAGYRYAMDKYNANEILNEVRKRAITVSQQRVFGKEISFSEYENNGKIIGVYDIVSADNHDGNSGYFTLTVLDIPKGICDRMIADYLPFAVWESVDGQDIDDLSECPNDTNDILFAFANDLEDGSVGEGEEGGGNPPEDIDLTAPENNIICNELGECALCDDTTPIKVSNGDLCKSICSNRELWNDYCVTPCPSGFRDTSGFCFSCDTNAPIQVTNVAECEDNCGDKREVIWMGNLYPESHCSLKEEACDGFITSSTLGTCYPCDTPEGIWLDAGGTCEKACEESGYKREKKGNYCVLETCNGFRDKTGGCHPCNTPEGIEATVDDCSKCSALREKGGRGNDYCILKNEYCSGFIDAEKKTCYPCDTPEKIYIDMIWYGGTCDENCPNRFVDGAYCVLEKCNGIVSFDGTCYPCDTKNGIYVGDKGLCSEACAGADKRFKKEEYCNICPKNLASPVLNTQEICEACGGRWNNGLCSAQ